MGVEMALSLTSIPGKIFLCGEYSVLYGGPALLARTEKKFTLSNSQNNNLGKTLKVSEFHPRSPAGILFGSLSIRDKKKIENQYFEDPFFGRGGFGASTAQFLFVWNSVNQNILGQDRWKKVLIDYHGVVSQSGQIKPSGADLVSQTLDESCVLFHPKKEYAIAIQRPEHFNGAYVFSATLKKDRKTNTHEHLNLLEQIPLDILEKLEKITIEALEFIADHKKFSQSLNDYAAVLMSAHLVSKGAIEDMNCLSKVPGVSGVKGCGARLSDVIIVFCDDKVDELELLKLAKQRDLEFIQKGLF